MTTQTNQTATEILTSFSNGQGKISQYSATLPTLEAGILTLGTASTPVSESYIEARFIYTLAKELHGKTSDNIKEFFDAIGQGRLALTHKTGDSKPVLSPAKQVLTAQEYKEGNITLAELDNLQLYAQVSTLLDNKTATKADLLEFLASIKEQLFSSDKQEVYLIKWEAEKELEKIYESLTIVRFRDIKQLTDGRVTMVLPMGDGDQTKISMDAFESAGYLIDTSIPDYKEYVMRITAKNK